MRCVVDDSERRHAAWHEAEIFFHPLLGCEGESALMQTLFKVVNIHLVHAFEDDEVMLVAFVIPEKQVLAMCGIKLFPIFDGFFDSRDGRMKVDVELDAESLERVNDFLLPFSKRMRNLGGFHWRSDSIVCCARLLFQFFA